MICVVIKGPSFLEAEQQIAEALPYASLVELRLDLFTSLDSAALKGMRARFSLPMIFTLRSQDQGGEYRGSEAGRMDAIRALLELNPEYLDLEYQLPTQFIDEIVAGCPSTKIILSYHNFEETPEDLNALYWQMQREGIAYYKIAVMAKNATDALRLICWKQSSSDRLIAISMGAHGQISRILGPIIGSPMTYASLEENLSSAPGQLTAKALVGRYQYYSLSRSTAVYGLIGDPVDQSISDGTHNAWMQRLGLNAIYLKIRVTQAELPAFLQLAKRSPFCGLSVTMPLKEGILMHLDRVDERASAIGAVNTLVFEEGIITGFNTDGVGALNAIESRYSVDGKRLLIIGAGGAAKAIAYEAARRGAAVTIINRDEKRARQSAEALQCTGKGLEEMKSCAQAGYEIIVNSTPAALPIHPDDILPGVIAMEVKTKPKNTPFLQHAMAKNCIPIYGYQMFIEQAIEQFLLWFKDGVEIEGSRKILEEKADEMLQLHHAEPQSSGLKS